MLRIDNVATASQNVVNSEPEMANQTLRSYSVSNTNLSSQDDNAVPLTDEGDREISDSVSEFHARPDDASVRKALMQSTETESIPPHILEIITGLQRELLLLRDDLHLELWMKKQNVQHIGRLYEDRVTSRSAELERQGLVSYHRIF